MQHKIKIVMKNIIFIVCIVFLILYLKCSDKYNEYHVQHWQGAFFLNDSTLGVVGWQFDYRESTDEFTLSEYFNIHQYYYNFNLNTKELNEICEISHNPDFYCDRGMISYNYPLLGYSTYKEQKEVGIYNINTNEKKILKSEEGYSGLHPLTISKNGRYFGYKFSVSNPDYDYSIYDLHEEKDVFNSYLHRPLYIDDSLKTAILLYPDNTQKFFIHYNLETEEMDTLCENTYGDIHFHVSNNITVINDNGKWKYFKNADFLEGNFEIYELENLIMDKSGACDINLTRKLAVYPTGSIFLVNYKEGKSPEVILEWRKDKK